MQRAWLLLHLFFSFSYVGSLTVVEWAGRAARNTEDWAQRAMLYDIIRLATRLAGLGSLVALAVFGNLLAVVMGMRFAADNWLRWVNALWIVSFVAMAALSLPGATRLAIVAHIAAAGGGSGGFDRALRRWRLGNVVQSVLYLALLVLMVLRGAP